MTDLLSDLETPSDAELISRVRGGDVAAYGDLFSRHVDSANRLARQLVRGPDSDDLVSEAFAKVLQVLQGGGGPDVAFRAYLLTAVRRLHIDRMRAGAKVQTSDDMEDFDPGVPFMDTAVAQFESGAAARAFATLPERWQLVLWHLEVEGQKPAEIATLLGMSANSVSALAYRAREGLRQAFLTMHLNDITETDCRWVNEHLGAYVRKGLSKRDTTKVQTHLDECRRCTAMYLELTEVNSNLRGIIAPVLLGAAAAGYLSSTGGAGGIGLAAFIGRARDAVSANAGAATAGAVAAGVAAVATAGIVLLPSSPERVMSADNPVVRTTPDLALSPSTSPGATARPSERPSAGETGGPSSAPSTTPSAGATAPAALLDDGGGTTSGPAALPGEPGVLPAPVPGVNEPPVGPGTDPGTGPGTNPGTDPGTHPGTDPGTGPGANPEPPAPGPSGGPNPGPGPAPNPDPVPNPDPTTNPDPGGDPGDGGGQDPVLLQAKLTVPTEQVNLSTTGITFPVQGDPALPTTLIVSMGSGGSGITFGDGGSCAPKADNPTIAICDTAPGGGGSTLAPVTADGGNNTFVVNMPLVPPAGVEAATLLIEVSVPDGYDTAGNVELEPLNWTAPKPDPQPASADVSLSTGADSVTLAEAGTYYVIADIDGLPSDFDGDVIVRVEGGATFVGGGKTLTLTDPGNGPEQFQLVADDKATDSKVRLGIDELDGYADDDPTNNKTDEIILPAIPTADLSLSGPDSVTQNQDGTYSVELQLGGVPEDYEGPVKLTASGAEFTSGGSSTTIPAPANGSLTVLLATVDSTSGGTVTLSVEALDGYIDEDPANNTTGSINLVPLPPVDAGVGAELVAQGNSGAGTVNVNVTVDDPQVPVQLHVGFDANLVQVTGPGVCREVDTGMACDLAGATATSFGVLLQDRSGNQTRAATLTFSVAVPAEYRDDNPANNSAEPVTLERFGEDGPGSGNVADGTGTTKTAARPAGETS